MLVGLSCRIPFVYKWHFDVVPNLLGKPVICPECNCLHCCLYNDDVRRKSIPVLIAVVARKRIAIKKQQLPSLQHPATPTYIATSYYCL